MFSYRDAEESRAARPGEHAHAQSAHKHWRKPPTSWILNNTEWILDMICYDSVLIWHVHHSSSLWIN